MNVVNVSVVDLLEDVIEIDTIDIEGDLFVLLLIMRVKVFTFVKSCVIIYIEKKTERL